MTNKISSNLAEYEIQSSSQAQSRPVSPENVKLGTFLLVKCLGKNHVFRYVVISQSGVEEDGEIKVMFLKKKNTEKTTFRPDENDISYIPFDHVIQILPNATMKQNGSRLHYEFNEEIDVLERR